MRYEAARLVTWDANESCLELGGFECVYIFALHMYLI